MDEYMDIEISDKGFRIKNVSNRVIIPTECGFIIPELLEYIIDINNHELAKNVYRDDNVFKVDFKLPEKDELSNFNDLRCTIKSYKHILAVFFSLSIVRIYSQTDKIRFAHVQLSLDKRADSLEYYLLNNPNNFIKTNKYFEGRIELDSYRLIQELFNLARNGNEKCRWLCAFNTPLQIWYIDTFQKLCHELISPVYEDLSDRKHYQQRIKNIRNIQENAENIVKDFKNVESACISDALHYTINQLIVDNTPLIGSYYLRFLDDLRKEAYVIDKTHEYFRWKNITKNT